MPNPEENLFRALVGPDHVRPSTPVDHVAGVLPRLIISPGSESELAEILRLSNEAGLAVIPRSGGTKIHWGNPPARADLILSTARLNKILEHAWADLTVTVEAGCTIKNLQETLAQHGQRLALDALWPEKSTIGGVLSTNDSGALRLRFGALRDLIIGVTIALPDGTLASSGGKVVKNVAGYDLPKLVTGAFGTLGVITRAVFRLHPLPLNSRTFSIPTPSVEETQRFILAIQDSRLAHTSLQSHFSDESAPVTDILFEGTEAGLAAQAAQLLTLCQPAKISEASSSVWSARQELWSFSDPAVTPVAQAGTYPDLVARPEDVTFAIAKLSLLPTNIARVMDAIAQTTRTHQLRWKALVYATGLGWLRLAGNPSALHPALQLLRKTLEGLGGSLVVLHRPETMPPFDAWGTPGDSLLLMKSVKSRLDQNGTLNPGRFVAGI
jgi:glycolate oxidase FAD binding subunit